MRWIKHLYTVALLLSVFILFVYSATYFTSVYTDSTEHSFYSLNENWTYDAGDAGITSATLPLTVPTDTGGTVTLSNTLPDIITDSDILQFYTSHYNVWVYVDDALIYENTAERFSVSKTTGTVCHYVNLLPSMAGSPVTIVFQNVYSDSVAYVPSISFGNERDILYSLIVDKLPSYVVSALLFVIGCIGLLCYAIFHKRLPESYTSLFWLALASIVFSTWSGFETQMMVILLPYHLAFSWYTFVALKLLLIPVIMFISHTYRMQGSRPCKILVPLSALDIVVTTALQYMGIADFKETLSLTLAIIFLTIVWIFSLFVSSIRKLSKQSLHTRPSTLHHFHILFVFVLSITVVLDFVSYLLAASQDASRFTRLAVLGYVIVLVVTMIQNALDLERTRERAQDLKEMAVTDPLTKLRNRASFEKDLAAISEKDQASYGIAMFDLNNLKYFNDVHGHSTGDYYIIICSEILQDLFCGYGNVYRIGGDEFCAIMKSVSPEKYAQISPMIAARLNSLHQSIYNYRMEVSDGYAAFDPNQDTALLQTMERADKMMYEKKQAMKAAAKAEAASK